MLKSLITAPHVSVLEQALSASSLRHKVISNNIANVNTPGYKKSDIDFAASLQAALDNNRLALTTTNRQHIALPRQRDVQPKIITNTTSSLRNDGNNVDIDGEMANMAENTIYYEAVAQQINRYFANIRSVINEGRR